MIVLGNEISGGIQDVRAEDINVITTESVLNVKTRFGSASIPLSFDDNNVVFVWE